MILNCAIFHFTQIFTVTNQSEYETNKYADKNRLHGYWFFFVGVCQQGKIASA